jgi:hypothetical protein
MYKNIVLNKDFGLGVETDFSFKYIPDYHPPTPDSPRQKNGIMVQGVERRNLLTLVLGGVVAGGVCLVWTRGLMSFLRW